MHEFPATQTTEKESEWVPTAFVAALYGTTLRNIQLLVKTKTLAGRFRRGKLQINRASMMEELARRARGETNKGKSRRGKSGRPSGRAAELQRRARQTLAGVTTPCVCDRIDRLLCSERVNHGRGKARGTFCGCWCHKVDADTRPKKRYVKKADRVQS